MPTKNRTAATGLTDHVTSRSSRSPFPEKQNTDIMAMPYHISSGFRNRVFRWSCNFVPELDPAVLTAQKKKKKFRYCRIRPVYGQMHSG